MDDRGIELSLEEVLWAVPQQPPFRFVDEILEVDSDRIVASYRFRPESDFYRGHFPGNPVTPGVILIEAMAQAGVVAHGIWLLARQHGLEALEKRATLFSDASVEFGRIVHPGERVVVTGRKQFFRRSILRSHVEMHGEDGKLIATGVLSGVGVLR